MIQLRTAAVALALAICSPALQAQMYKCQTPDGRTAFQDQPCTGAAKQSGGQALAAPGGATPATAPGAVIVECRANLTLPGAPANMLAVRITRTAQGTLQSQINGTVSNASFRPVESRISDNFDLKVDPYAANTGVNAGELSLAHLQSIRELTDIRFDLRAVRRTVIYDLQGTSDKYGGTVLIEAYSADNRLLGRVLRSVMASTCS